MKKAKLDSKSKVNKRKVKFRFFGILFESETESHELETNQNSAKEESIKYIETLLQLIINYWPFLIPFISWPLN